MSVPHEQSGESVRDKRHLSFPGAELLWLSFVESDSSDSAKCGEYLKQSDSVGDAGLYARQGSIFPMLALGPCDKSSTGRLIVEIRVIRTGHSPGNL